MMTLPHELSTVESTPDMRRMVKPLATIVDAIETLDDAMMGAWRAVSQKPLVVRPDDPQLLLEMAALGEAIRTVALQTLRVWNRLEQRMFNPSELEQRMFSSEQELS